MAWLIISNSTAPNLPGSYWWNSTLGNGCQAQPSLPDSQCTYGDKLAGLNPILHTRLPTALVSPNALLWKQHLSAAVQQQEIHFEFQNGLEYRLWGCNSVLQMYSANLPVNCVSWVWFWHLNPANSIRIVKELFSYMTSQHSKACLVCPLQRQLSTCRLTGIFPE